MTKKSKMEFNIEKYVGLRMVFQTKEGKFIGDVVGCMWMGASFIELTNPVSFFNTHSIIYAQEVIKDEKNE